MATLKDVESDVSLKKKKKKKKYRKWRQNLIKIVELTLKIYRKQRSTWKSYKI